MTRPLLLLVLLLLVVPRDAAAEALTVLVSVAGARVELDGEELAAKASQEVKANPKAGAHVLKVTKDGFQAFEQKFDVVAGEQKRIDVLLRVSGPDGATGVPGKAAPAIRVAVYELQAQPGFDPRVTGLVSEALLAEVRKLERVSAISMNEVKDMLSFEQQRQMLGCEQDACLAEIGGALGVDELVTGSMGAIGESQLVTIRRVDMKAGQVKGSVQKRLKSPDGEQYLALVGPSIAELFAEYPLRAGRSRGVGEDTLARLNPPPLPRWVVMATSGVMLLAVGTGAIYGARSVDAQGEYARLSEASLTSPVDASAFKAAEDRAEVNAGTANLLFATAGALVLVVGLEAIFTDWHGYRDEKAAPVVALAPAPGGLVVAGRF